MLLMEEKIILPKGTTATVDSNNNLKIKGAKGEVERKLNQPEIKIKTTEEIITLSSAKSGKRQKRILKSYAAHVKNMIKGVEEPYKYVLKICSGHFPMNVSISGNQLIIKNFLGEKSPRTLKLKGASVKIEGDQITVESPDKELAGKTASDIELLTTKSNKDLRIFQDGIYLTEKAGKKVTET